MRKYEDSAFFFFFFFFSSFLALKIGSPSFTALKVDTKFLVKLFYAGSPMWFTASRSAELTSKSMLPNFTAYMKCEYEKHDHVLEELETQIHKQKACLFGLFGKICFDAGLFFTFSL